MENSIRNILIMDSKNFKVIFGNIAIANSFFKAFGGWYKESEESIAILELQKSNFGDYYQLNIKIFIQGVFDRTYNPNKDLIKSALGHINSNETVEYKKFLDFDTPMDDNHRIQGVEALFNNLIVPFTNKTFTKLGIMELVEQDKIFILPSVNQEITKRLITPDGADMGF